MDLLNAFKNCANFTAVGRLLQSFTLVNVYVDLVVFTRIAGTS